MDPNISEFSYGYAVTDEFIHRQNLALQAAPVFPSLIEEGKTGGYDAFIDTPGFPLFLQFKLTNIMVRKSAKECVKNLFNPPFFRMHLRPLRHSSQHNLLLKLEAKYKHVYYVAPKFNTPAELNDAYLKGRVLKNSIFVSPSDIGKLPDDDNHHIAFKIGTKHWYVCSDPVKKEAEIDLDAFLARLRNGEKERTIVNRDLLNIVSKDMIDILRKDEKVLSRIGAEDIIRIRQIEDPFQRIGYISRTFFGCEALIVKPN